LSLHFKYIIFFAPIQIYIASAKSIASRVSGELSKASSSSARQDSKMLETISPRKASCAFKAEQAASNSSKRPPSGTFSALSRFLIWVKFSAKLKF